MRPEIRPIIRHATLLLRNGCSDASEAFTTFSYTQLSTTDMLPVGLSLEDFSPCEYLMQLQQTLFSTDLQDESVTYETFVVVPEVLNTSLYDKFGHEAEINGQFVSFHAIVYLIHFFTILT